MSDRKKTDKKPIPVIEPKKRVEATPIPKVEPKKREKVEIKPVLKEVVKGVIKPIEVEVIEPEPRFKRSENKYIKLALDAKAEEKKEFSDKVNKGELRFAFFGLDGDKGYHHYLVLKK